MCFFFSLISHRFLFIKLHLEHFRNCSLCITIQYQCQKWNLRVVTMPLLTGGQNIQHMKIYQTSWVWNLKGTQGFKMSWMILYCNCKLLFVHPWSTYKFLRTRLNMSKCSRLNCNLEVLVLEERGKPEYLEKNISEQVTGPITNSSHVLTPGFELGPHCCPGV